jgi:hypothetical protein
MIDESSARRRFLKHMLLTTGVTALSLMAASPAAYSADKASKKNVHYRPKPNDGEHCGQCLYFLAPTSNASEGHCMAVQGAIDPNGWCRLFEADPSS